MGRGVAGRALARTGQTVDVINYQQTGEDDYGEHYSKVTPVASVPARVEAGNSKFLRDALGADADLDAVIYVEDSVSIARDGGGEHATQIDVDGDGTGEYVVVFAHTPGNGMHRLDCRRRTD